MEQAPGGLYGGPQQVQPDQLQGGVMMQGMPVARGMLEEGMTMEVGSEHLRALAAAQSVPMVVAQQSAGDVVVPVAQEEKKKRKRRTQLEGLETTSVVTRWACPREPGKKDAQRTMPMSCKQCGGKGCTLQVYHANNKAEELVWVIERNENGSSTYMCKECGDSFLGTQARIIAHKLQLSHRGVATCRISPSDEVRAILEQIENKSGVRDTSKRRAAAESGGSRAKMPKDKLKLKDDEADLAIARFFYECGVPSLRAEDPAFHRMIRLVSECGAGYIPPTMDAISGDSRQLRNQIGDIKSTPSSGKPGEAGKAGLMSSVLQEMEVERADLLQSALRTGSTLVSDGSKNSALFPGVAYAVSTPKGVAFMGMTDVSQTKISPEFLSDDAAVAVARAGNNVFLMVMDGPLDVATPALELVKRIFPRMFTIRSAAYCWDLVLLEIGRKFLQEVIIPSHQILLHISNHPEIYNVFRTINARVALLEPAHTRMSAEVACVSALFEDRNNLKLLWASPSVASWLEHRNPARAQIKDRHAALGLQHVGSSSWWSMVDACVTMMRTAVPILAERNLDAANLHRIPLMYDEAVSALQRPLCLASGIGEADDGLTLWGGASVMGSPGDGSVQASILQALASVKSELVSQPALAAAMVCPLYIYKEPTPYEPEGGRAAINDAIQRYYSHNVEAQAQCTHALSMIRGREGIFGGVLAKRFAMGDPTNFYENFCNTAEYKPLAEIAIKLLNGCATIAASDRLSREIPGVCKGWSAHDRSRELVQMRMHYRIKERNAPSHVGGDASDPLKATYASSRNNSVLTDVRKLWVTRRMQQQAGGGGSRPDGLAQLTDVLASWQEPYLDKDIPTFQYVAGNVATLGDGL